MGNDELIKILHAIKRMPSSNRKPCKIIIKDLVHELGYKYEQEYLMEALKFLVKTYPAFTGTNDIYVSTPKLDLLINDIEAGCSKERRKDKFIAKSLRISRYLLWLTTISVGVSLYGGFKNGKNEIASLKAQIASLKEKVNILQVNCNPVKVIPEESIKHNKGDASKQQKAGNQPIVKQNDSINQTHQTK